MTGLYIRPSVRQRKVVEGRSDKEDDCTGTFWGACYKSIANLDGEALLATCASIDLNPAAAGMAKIPESSQHTSIKQRVDHARAIQGDLEQAHWLCPLLMKEKAAMDADVHWAIE